ncbi:MAG: protein translocase subunit SecD [Candidatus Melainabacteria bacterium]|nr:protein translocase subunit SecD [Candidatus Melainabacteria bacterium]
MNFLKRNFRLFIILATFLISFFSFFSFYLTGSYNHLKKLEGELNQAKINRESVVTERVVSLAENVEDPLQEFIKEKNLSSKAIKELETKIKDSQVIFQNPLVTLTTQLMLGLDLVGGAQLTFQAVPEGGVEITNQTVSGLIKVFENRVNASGTAEAIVQQVGKDRVLVEIPGAEPETVKRRLLKTAFLEFKEPAKLVNAKPGEKINPQKDKADDYIWLSTGITGKDLKRAQAVTDGAGNWLITFSLKGPAIEKFGRLTERLIEKPLAIFLDGRLISSPIVRSAITGGEGQIEGRFTAEEAQDLAVQLNAGALPVPVKIIQERSVGATLGQDSINKSLIAGIYGILLVILFMIVFYRLPGIIASIALLLYTLVTITIFEHTVTLTLAGIAGFILSIGMAVDANILIFERTKEELKAGKSFFNAIDAGFERAFSSIFDSNINTLIACFVLLIFGTGIVRGFAITLAIGVLVSMFSAIFVTKTLLALTTKINVFKNPVLFGVKI